MTNKETIPLPSDGEEGRGGGLTLVISVDEGG